MSRADSYRLVYSLMLNPDEVWLITVGQDRWVFDRYVLLNLTPLGVRHDFPTEDGCSSLRRTLPPKPAVAFGVRESDVLRSAARVVSTFEKLSDWRPVRPSAWGVADGEKFVRLLERQDAENRTASTWVNGRLLAAWEDALTGWRRDLAYEQQAGKSSAVIRVRITKPYGTHVSGKALISTYTVGYLMPIKRTDVPAFPESVGQVASHARPGGGIR